MTTSLKAELFERYRLEIGYSNTDFNSKVNINSRGGSIDKEIDFEDVLGLENNLKLGWFRGTWRMAERHRLAVLYMPIKRTSQLTSQNDINIGGNIIKTGATVNTEFNTHTFDIEYIYSLYKKTNYEIGLTAGFYWVNSRVQVTTAGQIIIDGAGSPEFRGDYETKQRLIAPLPLFGLEGTYEINPQWRALASARYFDVRVGEIDGRALSLNVSTEYYFNKYVGLGASIKHFEVSVQQNGVVLINALSFQYDDIQAYLVFKY